MKLSNLFIWFYCRSIPQLICWCIVCILGFLWLHGRYGSLRWRRRILAAALLVWAAVVLWATLFNRDGGEASFSLVPFHSYRQVLAGGNPEILRSSFMNMVLFLPAGVLSAALLPQRGCRRCKVFLVALFFASFSLCIEYAQYALALGQAEIDDVLHNTLGAVLGCLPVILCSP